jgi:hypothetical protein
MSFITDQAATFASTASLAGLAHDAYTALEALFGFSCAADACSISE